MSEYYKCQKCGMIVKVIYQGAGQLVCCGQPMTPLSAFQSINEIFDFAIAKEEEARQFYLEWSQKLTVASLQELFKDFANEELKHKQFLERIKSGATFRPTVKQVTDLKIVDYLVDVNPTPGMDYQEALILAMKREKTAFKFYSDLATMTADENLKATFLSLAQEEAKHKLRLETIYEKDIYTEN